MVKMNVKNINELIELTFTSKDNEQIKFVIGKIKPVLAEIIKERTGLSVDDYEHIIDNFAIRHTIYKHGDAKKEEKRGQVAVTLEYFGKIPDVIKNPDKVTDGGKNDIGRRVIIYEKRINGVIIYLEEIRTKRKELAMQTMWIKKAH